MSTMAGDEALLPGQTPHTLQEKIEQVRQQQALLAGPLASGNPQLMQRVDALREQYHASDMAALARDVYRSAAHEPAPAGLGWIRVSEHPELLRQRLGMDWSDQQIEDYLQPLHSDFRAEIYLPDPRVYGPSVKPVIATKGSNGPVAVPDGKGGIVWRESALEDWIENARQGVGLESDHADRAMKLAADFQRDFRGAFENVGHSKGAVGASAAADLTGMPAYIFNGAGLHPNTVQRYADQHHLHVAGADQVIHSYHVQGEMLHDVQAGIRGMDALTRWQAGLAARQLGELTQLDGVRSQIRERLAQALPYDRKMQGDAVALIDYLGSHSGAKILAGVPLAAGSQPIELPARMRDANGHLVPRPAQPTLGELGTDAGPLMNVVSGALAGGAAGKRLGEVIAAEGHSVERGLRWAGAGARQGVEVYGYVLNAEVQGHGRLVAGAMHYGGAAVADMRMVHGHLQASAERGMGALAQWRAEMDGAMLRASSHLPGLHGLRQRAEQEAHLARSYAQQQQANAANDLREARRDAGIFRTRADEGADRVGAATHAAGQQLQREAQRDGEWINDGYRTAGSRVRALGDRAPQAGAAFGAVTAATTAVAVELQTSPLSAVRRTDHVLTHGKAAASEAVARHSQEDVVQPSMDARTRQMEVQVIELQRRLEKSAPTPAPAPQPATAGENPHAFMQRMLDAAQSGDWAAFRQDTRILANMPSGQALHAEAIAAADRQQHAIAQQAQLQQPPSQHAAVPGMSR